MAILWNNQTDRDYPEPELDLSYLCRTGRCRLCGDPQCGCYHHELEEDR